MVESPTCELCKTENQKTKPGKQDQRVWNATEHTETFFSPEIKLMVANPQYYRTVNPQIAGNYQHAEDCTRKRPETTPMRPRHCFTIGKVRAETIHGSCL